MQFEMMSEGSDSDDNIQKQSEAMQKKFGKLQAAMPQPKDDPKKKFDSADYFRQAEAAHGSKHEEVKKDVGGGAAAK